MDGALRTTCPYCGTGCGLLASPDGTVGADPDHPANAGRLCSKGASLGETLGLDGRLLHPMVHGRRAGWGAALDLVAARFDDTIRRHGPDSVAFYVSGQLLTEDYYVANKLMKGFIGSGNIDTNSRLCMASSVAGHRRAFGTDTVPGCYDDLELADLVVLVGANPAWCHPVLYQRLARAREERGTTVVLIDPRRTATADIADLHLAIAPGGDAPLFNGLLAHLARVGAADQGFIDRHTSGFDAALRRAEQEAPDAEAVARSCGLRLDDVRTFFNWVARTTRTVTVWSQGVNQAAQGTDTVNAIINTHLLTGRIGRPGMGPFSVTGQPNAMGGREVGGLANQLAAHMGFDDPAAIDRLRRFWRAPRLATRDGLKAVDLYRAVGDGRIKALWIMATNPAVSLPEAEAVRAALTRCDFVVASDCVADTDTLRHAHVLLPAAGWGEKDGTVTNSERRISRQRAFRPIPGEARPDWWIISQVAGRLGWAEDFAYDSPAAIFREHAALSAFENNGTRDFDIGGLADLTDAAYDALEPVQWPAPVARPRGTARLFADGRFFTADGRARFVPVVSAARAGDGEVPLAEFPLVLNTGRVRDQWHTMTRTGGVPRLAQHCPEPFVEVHPDDAARAGIVADGLARVATATGSVVVRARVTADQRRGSVFVPMHWSDAVAAEAAVGRAVHGVTDPVSGQPDAKRTPARLSAVPVGWSGFLLTREARRIDGVAWWARWAADGAQVFELAGPALPDDLEAWAAALMGGRGGPSFQDAGRGHWRWARLEGDRLESCLFVSRTPALPARTWLAGLFRAPALDAATRGTILAGCPAKAVPDEGRLVCACLNVGLDRLVRAIRDGGLATVEQVGAALKAGTNCGSCLPEIREVLRRATA